MSGKEIVRLSPEALKEPLNLVPDLVNMPGFVALSEKEREWLRNETSAALTNYRKAAMHTLMWCIDIARVEDGLKGKPVSLNTWFNTVFPSAKTTGKRALKTFRMLNANADEEALIDLAQHGIPGMHNMQAGRIVGVLKKLPPPKVNRNEKNMAEWRSKLAEKLRQNFREVRAGREEKIDREEAAKSIALSVRLYLNKAEGVETSKEKRDIIAEAVAYLMEREAISGTITITRKPAPDGWWPAVGRPRGSKKKRE